MQWTTLCILLVAISEPLLSYASKVVVVVPRQVKRSPAIAWRPGPMHYRKSAHGNDYHHRGYHARPVPYYGKRPYHRPPPYAHTEDDYDQGYESINHVHVPYGKDIGHGMPFGKGYIPYDSMKGGYSYGRESHYPRYKGPKYMEADYPPTSYSSTGPDYPTGHSYESPHMDSLFPDVESALDYRKRRNDRKKYYASRSIEKELGIKAQMDLNSLFEREKEQEPNAAIASELYKEALTQGHDMQSTIMLPEGIPSGTIAGNKEGIVLRDTVALDDYHRKLQEITKSWPAFMNTGVSDNGASLQQEVHAGYPTAGLQGSSFTGPSGWLTDYAQAKQGYEVKEEFVEPAHDFRNMPIQTTHFQGLPRSLNVAVNGLSQTVHG